ncbi:hypothetical protein ACLOJK_012656 [Asimina triloba]
MFLICEISLEVTGSNYAKDIITGINEPSSSWAICYDAKFLIPTVVETNAAHKFCARFSFLSSSTEAATAGCCLLAATVVFIISAAAEGYVTKPAATAAAISTCTAATA